MRGAVVRIWVAGNLCISSQCNWGGGTQRRLSFYKIKRMKKKWSRKTRDRRFEIIAESNSLDHRLTVLKGQDLCLRSSRTWHEGERKEEELPACVGPNLSGPMGQQAQAKILLFRRTRWLLFFTRSRWCLWVGPGSWPKAKQKLKDGLVFFFWKKDSLHGASR